MAEHLNSPSGVDLDAVRRSFEHYRQHQGDSMARGWSCCSAHGPADYVPALVAEIVRLRAAVGRVISVTQDTDGDTLDPDTDIPVGEVLRMLYEFGDPLAGVPAAGRSANEPGA